MGALNLYSKTVGALDEEAHAVGSVFATQRQWRLLEPAPVLRRTRPSEAVM